MTTDISFTPFTLLEGISNYRREIEKIRAGLNRLTNQTCRWLKEGQTKKAKTLADIDFHDRDLAASLVKKDGEIFKPSTGVSTETEIGARIME